MEGTYSELYPEVAQNEAGLGRLFRQFSFPGGIPSHASPDTPGSIHEGGELGYSLAHAFGVGLRREKVLKVSSPVFPKTFTRPHDRVVFRMKLRRYAHPRHLFYQTTMPRHLASIAIAVALVVAATLIVLHFVNPRNAFDIQRISMRDILTATVNTFFRMLVAYIGALLVSIPVALGIASTPKLQRLLLPIADILQSVPVLAFFPVVVVFFTAYRAFEAAAIFVIFVQMIWNIVFPVIGGLQTIPDDIKSAAIVFNVHGLRKFWYITLPAILPFVVTGSLLAWAQGWTIVIVAEVLHTYIPHGTPSQDLLGLGSLLVDSNAGGETSVFVVTLTTMILLIALINLLVWQPLLRLSQRFRFD